MIAALNKYWRPISEHYFWHKMDMPATENAVAVSGFTEEVWSWITDDGSGNNKLKIVKSKGYR